MTVSVTDLLAGQVAECAVMGTEAAVEIAHRKVLAAAPAADRAGLKTRLVAAQRAEPMASDPPWNQD